MASAKLDPEDEMFEGLVHFIVHLWGMGHPRIPKGAFKDHERPDGLQRWSGTRVLPGDAAG